MLHCRSHLPVIRYWHKQAKQTTQKTDLDLLKQTGRHSYSDLLFRQAPLLVAIHQMVVAKGIELTLPISSWQQEAVVSTLDQGKIQLELWPSMTECRHLVIGCLHSALVQLGSNRAKVSHEYRGDADITGGCMFAPFSKAQLPPSISLLQDLLINGKASFSSQWLWRLALNQNQNVFQLAPEKTGNFFTFSYIAALLGSTQLCELRLCWIV